MRPCLEARCSELVRSGYCDTHELERGRPYERTRGTSTARGYGRRWQKLRAQVLREEPTCRGFNAPMPHLVPSEEVDHITPRREGGTDARTNLQALCHSCHSRKTAAENSPRGNFFLRALLR